MLKADTIESDSLLSKYIGQAKSMNVKMLDEFRLKCEGVEMTVTTLSPSKYITRVSLLEILI